MQPYSRFALLALALSLAACSSHSPRQAEPAQAVSDASTPPYSLERFKDERKLGEGVATVVLDNPYGDIQVRQTSASAIAIQGVEQRIGESPRHARIEWIELADRQGVQIRYAEHDPNQPANPRLGRVDLYAFVPHGVRVEARSDFGAIVVRRISNEVDGRSRDGRIVVAARGAMDLESDSGEIRAFPIGSDWKRPVRLRSRGGILADVPLSVGLAIEASAARGIRSDFEMDEHRRDGDGRWHARHRFDNGERRMWVESLEGDVLLQGLRPPSN